MKISHISLIAVGIITATIAFKSLTFPSRGFGDSTGAPLKKGVFSQYTGCNTPSCHFGNDINSSKGGIDIISDIPTSGWEAGKTYRIQVEIAHPDRRMWGFQFMAWGATDSMSVGTLIADKSLGDSALIVNAVRTVSGVVYPLSYATHTRNCIVTGYQGRYTYTFSWKAPDTRTQNVRFYATGLAANANGGASGDYVYLISKNADSTASDYRKDLSFVPQSRFELVTGIFNQLDKSTLDLAHVFPTVSDGDVFIRPKGIITHDALEITCIGLDGTIYLQKTLSGFESMHIVSLGNIPSGMYLLKLRSKGNSQITRIQKL